MRLLPHVISLLVALGLFLAQNSIGRYVNEIIARSFQIPHLLIMGRWAIWVFMGALGGVVARLESAQVPSSPLRDGGITWWYLGSGATLLALGLAPFFTQTIPWPPFLPLENVQIIGALLLGYGCSRMVKRSG